MIFFLFLSFIFFPPLPSHLISSHLIPSPLLFTFHTPQGDAGLDPQQEALICLKISDILSFAVLVPEVKIPQSRALEMTIDLTKIALKFSGPNITSAIACLAHIAGQITRSPACLLELAEKCFSSIVAISKATSTSTSTSTSSAALPVTHAQAARIQRCLVVLGSICEQSRKCSDLFQFTISNNNDNSGGSNDDKNANRNNGNDNNEENNNDDNNNDCDDDDDDDDGQTTYCSGGAKAKSLGFGQKSRPLTDEETAVADLADIGKVAVRNLNGCCYSACHYALSLPIPHVQARAVQSLCGVFVGMYRTYLHTQHTHTLHFILLFFIFWYIQITCCYYY